MQDEIAGRNDQCPCGSGKKYKKCCLLETLRTSDLIDPAWRKLRQTEGDLIGQDLLPYVIKIFPREIMDYAWDDFLQGEVWEWPAEVHEGLRDNMFIPWFLFDWVPDEELCKSLEVQISNQPIALQYLKKFHHRLSKMQCKFLEAICKTYYSFYVVLDVVPNQSIKLKDLMLNEECTVKEYQATQTLKRGDIIFARILTLDEVSICVGMAPYVIPSASHLELLDYRKKLEKKSESGITGAWLRLEGLDLRWTYFVMLDDLFNQPVPRLQNTDGHGFEFCKISYNLEVAPQEAFDRLLVLTLSKDGAEFLSDSKNDRQGCLKQVEFPWLIRGNKKNKDWDNTVMGTIKINGKKMTIEVNSQERAIKIKALVKKYLGDSALYQKTQIKSVESMMKAEAKLKKDHYEDDDFSTSPEAQALLKDFSEKHWKNWVNEPLPALNGLSPMEAVKNKESRERLEALLMDFERRNLSSPNNPSNPDVGRLRQKLGL